MISPIVWSLCMAEFQDSEGIRFAIDTPKSCSGGFLTMVNLGYRRCRRERRRGRDLSRKAVPSESDRRSCSVSRIFSTVIGLCVGGVVFYFPSTYAACDPSRSILASALYGGLLVFCRRLLQPARPAALRAVDSS